MANYRVVDITERKEHLDYFMSINNPHVEVTVDVDMSDIVVFCKENDYPFFLVCLHVFACAAEAVPELRQRIHIIDEDTTHKTWNYEIREYEKISTSHTEQTYDNSYCYCTIYHDMPFKEYIEESKKAQLAAKKRASLEEDSDVERHIFASCLPWFHYRMLSNPTNGAKDSNPRISWGKYEEDFKGRQMMPVTLTVHHGLVDGIHMAKFYENIPFIIEKLTSVV